MGLSHIYGCEFNKISRLIKCFFPTLLVLTVPSFIHLRKVSTLIFNKRQASETVKYGFRVNSSQSTRSCLIFKGSTLITAFAALSFLSRSSFLYPLRLQAWEQYRVRTVFAVNSSPQYWQILGSLILLLMVGFWCLLLLKRELLRAISWLWERFAAIISPYATGRSPKNKCSVQISNKKSATKGKRK